MRTLGTLLKTFREDESGTALVEYSILLGIIVAAVIVTVGAVGTWINGEWTAFNGNLP